LKNKIKCNSYGNMEIWSNFDHSKVSKYDLAKVDKEEALDMNLLFHTTTCTKSL
jgi:hypothetical protein